MFWRLFAAFPVILMTSAFVVAAQENTPAGYSLNVGLGAEKVGLPFRDMLEFPVHSAYRIGIERKWSDQASKSGYQSLDIYLFSNSSAGLGCNIQTSYAYKISILNNLFISPSAGVGLVYLFRPKESFHLDNGVYKLHNDRGILRPEAHLGMKVGYSVNRIDVFGSYQTGFQYGYNKDIQFLPRTFLVIGLSYGLRRKTEDGRRKT